MNNCKVHGESLLRLISEIVSIIIFAIIDSQIKVQLSKYVFGIA